MFLCVFFRFACTGSLIAYFSSDLCRLLNKSEEEKLKDILPSIEVVVMEFGVCHHFLSFSSPPLFDELVFFSLLLYAFFSSCSFILCKKERENRTHETISPFIRSLVSITTLTDSEHSLLNNIDDDNDV